MDSAGVSTPYRVLQTLPDLQVGGGQVMALNAIRQVDPARYRFDVLALHPATATMTAEFRRHGVDPYLLEHRSGRIVAEVATVARLLRRRRIDLVHVHGHDERQIVLPAALALGVPAICQLNSEWVHLGRTAAPEGSGDAGQAAAGRRGSYPRRRSSTGPPGSTWHRRRRPRPASEPFVRAPMTTLAQSVPAEIVDAASAGRDPAAYRSWLGLGPGPVAVNVARAVPGKGHDRLLRNFRRVVDRVPDAQLVLIGDGELHDDHLRLAEGWAWAGRSTSSAGAGTFPACWSGPTCSCSPRRPSRSGWWWRRRWPPGSRSWPTGCPPSTASARPGVTGSFPEQDDDGGFVDAVVELLADEGKRRRQGEAGAAAVLRRFPPDATARSYEAAYRQVLEAEATSRPARRRRRLNDPPPAFDGPDDQPGGPHAPSRGSSGRRSR